MKISITQKVWDIPKIEQKRFNTKELEYMLETFNRARRGNYYITDYYHEKFVIDTPSSLILCGHSKEIAEQEGFGFLSRILKPAELEWIHKMNAAGYKTLFRYPPTKRLKSVIFYDLTVRTADGEEFILHHKVIPYKLCRNGNMWLGLCYATISSSKKMEGRATFYNSETGERYTLIDDEFVLSDTEPITPDDVQILKGMIKEMPTKVLASLMKMSESNLNRKKRLLYTKLNASTGVNAIHNAHVLGII